MKVAILGSGRSGTSMISRMLNLCGFHLGRFEDIYHADRTNQRGSWEHARFNDINDQLFQHFGGTFSNPPKFPEEWHLDPALNHLYEQAQALIDTVFEGHENWAWKMPRASMTMPFWQRLTPGLKLIITVRNPLDVAASLYEYYGMTQAHALDLIHLYNIILLNDTSPKDRIITHYEEYFPDYRVGLFPVLDFLDIAHPPLGSSVDSEITAFHTPDLKHHSSTLDDLNSNPYVAAPIKDLYAELLNGPRDGSALKSLAHADIYLPFLYHALEGSSVDLEQVWELARQESMRSREAELQHQINLLMNEREHLEQILDSRVHKIAARAGSTLSRLRFSSAARMRTLPAPSASASDMEPAKVRELGNRAAASESG